MVGLRRFACADFHTDLALRRPTQRLVGADKSFRTNVFCKIDNGSGRIIDLLAFPFRNLCLLFVFRRRHDTDGGEHGKQR